MSRDTNTQKYLVSKTNKKRVTGLMIEAMELVRQSIENNCGNMEIDYGNGSNTLDLNDYEIGLVDYRGDKITSKVFLSLIPYDADGGDFEVFQDDFNCEFDVELNSVAPTNIKDMSIV